MEVISLNFRITDEWPTSIVRDFDQFLDAVREPSVYLTKAKSWLNRTTLYALNQEVLTYQSDNHKRTDQPFYPLLNLFYHISLAACFFQLKRTKSKVHLRATEIVSKYQQLSVAEKYLALFEGFWVKCDWVEMFREGANAYQLPMEDQFVEALLSFPACEEINARKLYNASDYSGTGVTAVIQVFSFFGILTHKLIGLSPKEQNGLGRGFLRLRSFTISEFGRKFLEALHEKRPFELWNMPSRIELGEARFPGQDFSETGESTNPEPFFEAFKPIMSKGTVLNNSLPGLEAKPSVRTYIFRVSIDDVWRTIAISGKNSLEDLHLAIQEAFDFENDHLYAFSLDHLRLNPRKSFNDPRGGDYPFADETIIGRLNLYEGQRLLYVFDFGDWWEFDVELLEIQDKIHFGEYKIIEKHGEDPEQYASYDDEDW
jgi:hypothetical protein